MNRPILAAVAIVLLLAVAATAWLLTGGAPTRTSSAGPPTVRDGGALPATPDGASPEAVLEVPREAGAGARVALESAVDSAAERAQERRAARAATTLAGQVLDGQGQPVVGARVLGLSVTDVWMAEGPPLDVRAPWGDARERLLEAQSDAQGRFELAGAQPGKLRLAVRAAGFSPHDDDGVVLPAGERHDVGAITLDASPIVEGRVVDSRGRGVADARLERLPPPAGSGFILIGEFGGGSGVPQGVTRADGSFTLDQLPVGPLRLSVLTEEHPDKTEALTTARSGERVAGVVIALDDGFPIAGRVLGIPAERSAELRVSAATHRQAGGDFDGDFGDFDFDFGGGSRSASIAADGSFTVQGLREGKSYDLSVRSKPRAGDGSPFARRLSTKVTARAGERGVELQFQPESGITFTVVDAATQQPLEKYAADGGLGSFDGGRVTRTNEVHAGGVGRIGELRPKRATDTAHLTITALGYRKFERADIALLEGGDVDLGVIALQPVPTLKVVVLDERTGRPIGGASVQLRKAPEASAALDGGFGMSRSVSIQAGATVAEDDTPGLVFDDEDSRTGRTDANGVVTLNSFEGERCELAVEHREFAPYSSAPFVCAAGGHEEREVRLSEGGRVRVTLVGADRTPVAGAQIEHRPAPADGAASNAMFADNDSAVTDSAGEALFAHLAAGAHEFRPEGFGASNGSFGGGNFRMRIAGAPGDEAGWETALVSEGNESALELVAPTRSTLSGVVREAGQPLAGALVTLEEQGAGGLGGFDFFGGGPQARTDGRGRYSIENVRSGEYTLSVAHATRQMPAEFEVSIGEQDRSFDIELSVAIIEGRVVGSDGKPLSGVKVSVEPHQGGGGQRMRAISFVMDGGDEEMNVFGGSPGASKPALTDDDGRYALRGVAVGRELVVKAQAKGLRPAQSEPLTLHDGELKRGVDLRLEKAGRIEVSAFKADGSPANMVLITATREDEGEQGDPPKTGFIQASGKTTLDGLAPGKWKLSAQQLGIGAGREQRPAPLEQVVEVKADETTPARFDLP